MWWLGEPTLFSVPKLVYTSVATGTAPVGNAASRFFPFGNSLKTGKCNSVTITPVYVPLSAELCEDGEYERGYLYA